MLVKIVMAFALVNSDVVACFEKAMRYHVLLVKL